MNPFTPLPPPVYNQEEKGCEKCEGGWIFVGRNQVRPCSCMEAKKAQKALEKSGLSKVVNSLTFTTFIPKEPWQQTMKTLGEKYVKDILKGGNPWFFIGGQVGSGKTHICSAICGELLKANFPVRYMVWPSEAGKMKGAALDYEKKSELMYPFLHTEVLYIDDFFKTANRGQAPQATEADVKLAFELLNYRYNVQLPTLISCEWPLEALFAIDEGTISRIYEQSRGYRLTIDKDLKKNYRLKHK